MFGSSNPGDEELRFLARLSQVTRRRTFIQWSGVTIAAVAAGCSADEPLQPSGRAPLGPGGTGSSTDPVNLGSGDVLVLNFAYALEQLEAAFYSQVISTPYSGISDEEMQILDDVRKHELIHRDFFKEALDSLNAAIPALEVDFTSVDFTSRQSVLETARTFEDLGVSAYNGAGKYLENLDYLLVAGKIVSVEARHAAAIRDLLNPKSGDFAGDDVVDAQGLDVVNTPADVFAAADPFIVTEIDTGNLPTT
ncbi:MAG: ferritin-like domain-containing protein [Gemmatimonadales bacterium]|nr:ferritin-like domain-containing protein [Gemmatimonadales bacterium]MBA3553261.1 ferritin-like domain-containing protein [Gemmatimonadales bacterium]